jgi:hypothetical protein
MEEAVQKCANTMAVRHVTSKWLDFVYIYSLTTHWLMQVCVSSVGMTVNNKFERLAKAAIRTVVKQEKNRPRQLRNMSKKRWRLSLPARWHVLAGHVIRIFLFFVISNHCTINITTVYNPYHYTFLHFHVTIRHYHICASLIYTSFPICSCWMYSFIELRCFTSSYISS